MGQSDINEVCAQEDCPQMTITTTTVVNTQQTIHDYTGIYAK